jgi:hypothetical protein
MPLASNNAKSGKMEDRPAILLKRTSSMNRLSLPHTAPSSTKVDVIKVLRRQSVRLKRSDSSSSIKENAEPNEKKRKAEARSEVLKSPGPTPYWKVS